MLTKKEVFYLVLLGIAAGFFLTFYPAGLFVLLLFLCALFLIKTYIKTKSSGFLIKLFVISFTLRALLCAINYNVGLNYPFWGGDTQPDATVYNINAFYVSHLLKENTAEENFARAKDPYLDNLLERTRRYYKNEFPPVGNYQFDSHVFILGAFYAWLGYAPVAAKMMNSLFGCISIIIVYLITRRLFEEEKPARVAAVIYALFPSILYWSVTGLRDTLYNLIFLSYFLCLVEFITEKKFKFIIRCLPFIYLLNYLRPNRVLTVIVAGTVMSFVFVYLNKLWSEKKPILQMLFRLGIYFVLLVLLLHRNEISSKVVTMANKLSWINIQFGNTTDYRIYSDLVYQQGRLNAGDVFSFTFLVSVFKALVYFFFAPFPFWNWTLSFLPFYPQVVYWYLMVPFVVKGWMLFLKRDAYTAFVLALSLLILIIPAVLFESNIGTAFRHKDMFIPVAFMFAAYAFTRQKAE